VPAPQNDRYDPLPGLLQLPSFLYRKLGPRGRVAATLGGAVLVVGLVVAAIVLVPRIADTKRERADRERREAAAAQAERRERLISEQRPHRGSASARSRGAVLDQLEAAILADARARAASGGLSGPAAKSVRCRLLTGADPDAGRVPYDCIAITSELPSDGTLPQGVIGHPFRAVVHYATGRYTWCKISGRAGEGGLSAKDPAVSLPRACSR
jgi:hypothetical protein